MNHFIPWLINILARSRNENWCLGKLAKNRIHVNKWKQKKHSENWNPNKNENSLAIIWQSMIIETDHGWMKENGKYTHNTKAKITIINNHNVRLTARYTFVPGRTRSRDWREKPKKKWKKLSVLWTFYTILQQITQLELKYPAPVPKLKQRN